jgi:hypothetical protein
MSIQINLRISDKMYAAVKRYAQSNGFSNIQDFIRESVRERVYGSTLTKEELGLARKLSQAVDERKLFRTGEQLTKKLKD